MEIFTEVIIVKKYKFCDELWDIIKSYIGIYGINLRIPSIMSLSNMHDINVYNKMCFETRSKSYQKKNLYVKFFYDNLRLKNKEEISTICDTISTIYENRKFTIPEDLKIGETILIYSYAVWERDPDIGLVSKINKLSFTVKVQEKNSLNGKYYDKVRIVKNNKYLRKEKATNMELVFFTR